LIVVNGQYGHPQGPQLIPVSDGAGEVVELGSGITRLKVGDRVMGMVLPTWISGEITPEKMKEGLGGRLDGLLAE
jgi:NADPH:quinone reductase-like Zn-dependent oxidoreductase